MGLGKTSNYILHTHFDSSALQIRFCSQLVTNAVAKIVHLSVYEQVHRTTTEQVHTHTSTDLVVCHARSDVTALKYGAKCNPILKQIENFSEVISL